MIPLPADSDRFHVYWLGYPRQVREGRHHVLADFRDGAAVPHILEPLRERGFRFGDIVPNGPPSAEELHAKQLQLERESTGRTRIEDVVDFNPLDISFLTEKDLMLVATRPPMNDLVALNRRFLHPGFTILERDIFRIVRQWLSVCSRRQVCMSEALARLLPHEYANRAALKFYQQGGPPWYKSLAVDVTAREMRGSRKQRRTAAYLLRVPSARELNGAGLLLFWGMGADQTAGFARRLRGDLSRLIDVPGFSMVEFTVPDDDFAARFDFAERWDARVLLEGAWPDSIPGPAH